MMKKKHELKVEGDSKGKGQKYMVLSYATAILECNYAYKIERKKKKFLCILPSNSHRMNNRHSMNG